MFARFRSFVLPFLGVLCAGWVVTAAPAPTPPAERVTVKKADGTTLAGELAWADHDGLGVRAAGKADPVPLKWADVASVSNGLTRQVAINRWRIARLGKLCGTCNGFRYLTHGDCNGTGVDPAAKRACAACQGAGGIGKCTAPKCKDGKLECPGPCLKLSVGTWKMEPDGKRWHTMVGRRSSYRISEGHVGEVWGLKADGSGFEKKGPCATCGGTSKLDCDTCQGKGLLPCRVCGGVGVTGPACKECTKGKLGCDACKGSGLAPA